MKPVVPHLSEAKDVLKALETDSRKGLTTEQAERRLKEFGPNELKEHTKKSVLAILFDQVKEVLVLILLGAAVVSFFLNETIDAFVILAIVVLNTIIGFWQENKAENAMAALRKLAVPTVRVRRNGQEKEISAKELVPGDVLILEAGNIVPADGRLFEAANLRIEEAALTGESEPVEKDPDRLKGEDIPVADRSNMVFSGTIVTYGRGVVVITHTGMETELGKIATLIQTADTDKTPLQKRLARLGGTLSLMAIVLILVVAVLATLRGVGLKETVMTAISMAVAAIPEGLPAVVTISLALGAQRMLKKKSLIRHLPAVETLGSVTVICSDKTGTITQNRMTVTHVVLPQTRFLMDSNDQGPADSAGLKLALLAGTLCNDARLTDQNVNNEEAVGDPTEAALVVASNRLGLDKDSVEAALPRVSEFPFDSERKRMTTVHRTESPGSDLKSILSAVSPDRKQRLLAFTKGSVDGLLEICDRWLVEGKIKSITEKDKELILEENRELAGDAIRVLGVACRTVDKAALEHPEQAEKDLIYIGMIGMIDPVRPEAVEAVRLCRKAGIRVVMISGDYPLTALAIARELGIAEKGKFLTGQDLSKMSLEEVEKQIDEVSVFARVAPEHKMKLIDALQDKHQIVSMTGDGVNDAPALKSADIGVAMGVTGTDVARESSDMVLLDDNFATIVAAVKEGRNIYDNLRKFIKSILAGNAGEIATMLTGPILGMPLPLLPIQILWINLVTDGVPAIALGYEEAEAEVMERPPYNPKEGIFARGLGKQVLLTGLFMGFITIAVGFIFWKLDPGSRTWQTMVFSSLAFQQLAYALCCRKFRQSVLKTPLHSNPVLLGAVIMNLTLQLCLIYIPFLNIVFRTTPLSALELGICFGTAGAVMLLSEVRKWMERREVARQKSAV